MRILKLNRRDLIEGYEDLEIHEIQRWHFNKLVEDFHNFDIVVFNEDNVSKIIWRK